jgi:hypothetical protein
MTASAGASAPRRLVRFVARFGFAGASRWTGERGLAVERRGCSDAIVNSLASLARVAGNAEGRTGGIAPEGRP